MVKSSGVKQLSAVVSGKMVVPSENHFKCFRLFFKIFLLTEKIHPKSFSSAFGVYF